MRSRASLSVAIIAFALYLITLAPTITWANFGTDGGDLITAAVTLGVPHPPGYPLYTTLGYVFAQLPIGTVAFRLNLSFGRVHGAGGGVDHMEYNYPHPSPPPSAKSSGRGRKFAPFPYRYHFIDGGRGGRGRGFLPVSPSPPHRWYGDRPRLPKCTR